MIFPCVIGYGRKTDTASTVVPFPDSLVLNSGGALLLSVGSGPRALAEGRQIIVEIRRVGMMGADAAVDGEALAGHEAGLIRRQVGREGGDIGGDPSSGVRAWRSNMGPS